LSSVLSHQDEEEAEEEEAASGEENESGSEGTVCDEDEDEVCTFKIFLSNLIFL
jgi:hypothetical protein